MPDLLAIDRFRSDMHDIIIVKNFFIFLKFYSMRCALACNDSNSVSFSNHFAVIYPE